MDKSRGGSIPHWGHLSSQCVGPLGLYVSLFMWQCLSVCRSTIVHSDRRGGQGFTERGRGRKRWPVLIQTIMPWQEQRGSEFTKFIRSCHPAASIWLAGFMPPHSLARQVKRTHLAHHKHVSYRKHASPPVSLFQPSHQIQNVARHAFTCKLNMPLKLSRAFMSGR